MCHVCSSTLMSHSDVCVGPEVLYFSESCELCHSAKGNLFILCAMY